MKLSNKQLRQIIKEELESVLSEGEENFDAVVYLKPFGEGASGGNAYKFEVEFHDKTTNEKVRFMTQKNYPAQAMYGSDNSKLHLAAAIFNNEGHPEVTEKIKTLKTQVISGGTGAVTIS